MADILCDIDSLDVVLEEAILMPFAESCAEEMGRGIDKTMKDMVKRTKKTAPTDQGWENFPSDPERKAGTFAKSITWKSKGYGTSHVATWYVRSPEHRLTHLLENGHELFLFGRPTGRRARAFGFVQDARDEAERELTPNIKAEIEKGGTS